MGFARGDPLLTEFADFMRTAGSSEKDIGNKVSKNNLLLFIFILNKSYIMLKFLDCLLS